MATPKFHLIHEIPRTDQVVGAVCLIFPRSTQRGLRVKRSDAICVDKVKPRVVSTCSHYGAVELGLHHLLLFSPGLEISKRTNHCHSNILNLDAHMWQQKAQWSHMAWKQKYPSQHQVVKSSCICEERLMSVCGACDLKNEAPT